MNKDATVLAKAIYSVYEATKNKEEEGNLSKSFARMLARKNLLYLVPKICKALEDLEKEKKGIVDVEIVSAKELTGKDKEKIEKWFSDKINKDKGKINTFFTVDESIIGGFTIRTKDVLIDRSIKTKLHQLSKKITK